MRFCSSNWAKNSSSDRKRCLSREKRDILIL
nr:MAG TPA: hypothetical protein [Caudoviricetes sp.]DAS71450.1 MAG TPA: hypothetical protein [Caudoviricetes sp.]